MSLRLLPLIVAFLPMVGVNLAYLLASGGNVVETCNPYLDGCTSISSTGRQLPGALPFRASLFPQAALLVIFWLVTREWLIALKVPRYGNPLLLAGTIGALSLLIYVTFLGTTTPFYEFMRRFGIYFYFLGTAVAQLLTTLALPKDRFRRLMLAVTLAPWVLGIANLLQKAALAQPNNVENRVEWWASLLLQLWFLLFYRYWRRNPPVFEVRVRKRT